MAAFAVPAQAYRPFDGTDASVAPSNDFQLEAGLARAHEGSSRSLALPELVGTLGLGHDTEVGLEGRLDHLLDEPETGHRVRMDDTAITVKHLLHGGSLQEGSGPSLALECSALLPELHGSSRWGAGCPGIASRRWRAATLHVDLGLERTRERTTNRIADVMVEGPDPWPVRPVAEFRAEHDDAGGWAHSVLGGAVWTPRDDLALDFGVRTARTSSGRERVLRIGLTWCLPLGSRGTH